MKPQHVDVLIVGAGISGIGAACHLQKRCPGKSWAILEARDGIGGTWDLFKYPGIRSDSDMYTLGYRFKPWREVNAIADGPSIMNYLHETVSEYNLGSKIRFNRRASKARWSSDTSTWTLEVVDTRDESAAQVSQITCNFLFMCTGYYNYAHGYEPEFPGQQDFRGTWVHPQKWPQDLDYAGRRVLIIGSGATAVTIVPEVAKQAQHVTMVQRSPTYMVCLPRQDRIALFVNKWLPRKLAYWLVRWKNILWTQYFYTLTRVAPDRVKEKLLGLLRPLVGDKLVDEHFTPTYNPWDQRLCLVPDADMFSAINDGKAAVETGQIERITETGIRMQNGKELQADIIVSATGLDLQFLNNLEITVDDRQVDVTQARIYKAMMMSGVPNLAWSMGYTNASWTLKCDLTCDYVSRLLRHMERHGYSKCVPEIDPDNDAGEERLLSLTAGYVLRSAHKFPLQGARAPWKLRQNYLLDLLTLRYMKLEDGAMQFSPPRHPQPARSQASTPAT